MNPLEKAQQLDRYGLNVLPAGYQEKAPAEEWRKWQTKRTTARLHVWFGNEPSNFWVLCGRISQVVVLDVDSEPAERFWRNILGDDLLDSTVASRTRKGIHYWFRIEPDDLVPSWSVAQHAPDCSDPTDCDCHDSQLFFDVRAEGTGVIAPGSVHESGFEYAWLRSPDDYELQPLPDLLRSADAAGLKSVASQGGGHPRSMLAKLLSDPPSEGGRNIWLSRVAGHYAKQHRSMPDLYEVETRRANEMLTPPLDEVEFRKTVDSIWQSEQAKGLDEIEQANEDNGYLMSAGDHLVTPVRYKEGEEWVTDIRQWSNFDIRTVGVVEDPDAERTYDVIVHRKRQGDQMEALLPARVLADPRQLDRWLAEFGVGITPPSEREFTKTRATVRLQSYLESQHPPHFSVVPALGWYSRDEQDQSGFICHEGVIRADGLHPFSDIKPDPILRNRAPYSYGFLERDEARRVLRRVLTFHWPQVASVFGAWWAACLLKPQLQAVSSQFPFMALEAPSESGKTTGMFSKLIQLNGNLQGQTSYTPASLRNAIAAHSSGIVWIDDEDSVGHLMQLLRMATGEGSYTKMGEDHHSSVTVRLVAPVLISGEALQMSDQKALRDRAVMLNVPTPTGRRSEDDPTRAQWDDIVELSTQYPDLSIMAGTMVQLALQHQHLVAQLPKLRGSTSRRFGDKIAILRVGARVLSSMTGDPGHVDVVDSWVDEQVDHGNENTLTLKILPEALATLGWPNQVEQGFSEAVPTPVFYRKATESKSGLWFSVSYLASWWNKHHHGRIETRTETRGALEQQARALGLPTSNGTTRVRLHGASRSDARPTYWRLPDDLAQKVLDRSLQGEDGYTEQLYPQLYPRSESPSDHSEQLSLGENS